MIKSIKFTEKANFTPWWDKVAALKKSPKIEFTDGLNILWGKNGSGKSTVLKAISKSFYSEQGGTSVVTETAIYKGFSGFSKCLSAGYEFEHDGQAVSSFDSTKKYGVNYNELDYDFMKLAMNSVAFKGSSGESVLNTYANLFSEKPDGKIKWEVSRESVNDLWVKKLDQLEEVFKPNIEVGNKTILMDEPDRSLDWDMASNFWNGIELVKNFQFIIATHNPLVFKLKNANFIEFTENRYLAFCKDLFKEIKND